MLRCCALLAALILVGLTTFEAHADRRVALVIGNSEYREIPALKNPDKDAEALTKLSPMTHIEKVKAPLLIVQGATDPRVPAGEAIQIHDALAKRGLTVDLMIFPDEGHGAQKRENRVVMYGHALAFLEKHLK